MNPDMIDAITITDLEEFLSYVKQHEAEYDSFNVAMAETLFTALVTFVKGRREQQKGKS